MSRNLEYNFQYIFMQLYSNKDYFLFQKKFLEI